MLQSQINLFRKKKLKQMDDTETMQTINAKLLLHPQPGLRDRSQTGGFPRYCWRNPPRPRQSRDVQEVHVGAGPCGGADRGHGGDGRGGSHDRGTHGHAAVRPVTVGAGDQEE